MLGRVVYAMVKAQRGAGTLTSSRIGLRMFATKGKTDKEELMSKLLVEKLNAKVAEVVDTSGGCGEMYKIRVESPQFEGKTRIEQHRMVQELLKEQLKNAHGFNISTSSSK
eukprot:TRINITY_DN747_c0_g1_i1.p1 TRINITY_DN747_c0_g1~~TRINITY_DN747_c0_g1_i1.p1  ORF type:complete len:111 (-),score=26.37 TRINITY_DN747_c0_g1_i1:53-385(-)